MNVFWKLPSVNRHNSRYWSHKNSHLFHEFHTQNFRNWSACNCVVCCFFMNPWRRNAIFIRHCLSCNDIHSWTLFNMNSSSLYYTFSVRQYLNQTFLDRWIGWRDLLEWPLRSPDFSPLDFLGSRRQQFIKSASISRGFTLTEYELFSLFYYMESRKATDFNVYFILFIIIFLKLHINDGRTS